jgi:hypothetical protein
MRVAHSKPFAPPQLREESVVIELFVVDVASGGLAVALRPRGGPIAAP